MDENAQLAQVQTALFQLIFFLKPGIFSGVTSAGHPGSGPRRDTARQLQLHAGRVSEKRGQIAANLRLASVRELKLRSSEDALLVCAAADDSEQELGHSV